MYTYINGTETPKINPHIYLVNWCLTKEQNPFDRKIIVISTHGDGTIGHLCAKYGTEAKTVHHLQKRNKSIIDLNVKW